MMVLHSFDEGMAADSGTDDDYGGKCCAGNLFNFLTLEWQRPDGITPLISSADETD